MMMLQSPVVMAWSVGDSSGDKIFSNACVNCVKFPLKTLDKIMGFSVHVHLFYNL